MDGHEVVGVEGRAEVAPERFDRDRRETFGDRLQLREREAEEPPRRRRVSAPDVDARRGELDQPLQEDAVVPCAFVPEALPILVRLERPPGPELLEPLFEERVPFASEPHA